MFFDRVRARAASVGATFPQGLPPPGRQCRRNHRKADEKLDWISRGGAVVVALPATAIACGGDDGAEANAATMSGAAATDSSTAAASFPVAIEHKHGESVVPEAPERVPVGFSDQDTILTLGVILVGVRDSYGDQPFDTWPWAQDDLGDAQPEVLSNTQLNIEGVAAFHPDVIIGVYSA